jgi:hypothetical protein
MIKQNIINKFIEFKFESKTRWDFMFKKKNLEENQNNFFDDIFINEFQINSLNKWFMLLKNKSYSYNCKILSDK